MIIELPAILSVLTLLAIASAVYFIAKKIHTPYTVLLVATGFLLVPLSRIPFFSFIREFSLTPTMLFYVFLPILIFESAYNMNTRRLMENIRSISLLSIISLLISAFFIAFAIHFIFGFFGFTVPFLLALLFGALISATDPVAVLALFKDFGAPRRLSLILEGESLFNDGTAVALFLVLLEIAVDGFHGFTSITEGIFLFTTMVFGGIVFGGLMGIIFSKAIEWTRSNESVSITLMFVVAHLTYVLTELISEHFVIYGHEIKFSAIIATLVASMVIGNYGRTKISPHAEEFIEKFWGQAAFMANSIVFLLIGLIFTTLSIHPGQYIWPIIGAILIVALGRALSIYPVIGLLNWSKKEKHIPLSWQHLLSWGSLRGALAVMVVLLIPDTLTFAGWEQPFSPKEFIMALTIGCIYATLFIKGTTIAGLMKKLKVDALTDIEKETREESLFLIHQSAILKLEEMRENDFIDESLYKTLGEQHEQAFKKAVTAKTTLEEHPGHELITRQILEIQAIATEKQYLKTLFTYGEITEPVYKKILNKLTIQLESAEAGNTRIDRAVEFDKKNIVELFMEQVNRLFPKPAPEELIGETYMYYRAQSIIARKALVTLHELIEKHHDIFNKEIADEVLVIYNAFREASERKMAALGDKHKKIVEKINENLAKCGLFKAREIRLNELREREMITPKLYLELKEEIEKEAGIAA